MRRTTDQRAPAPSTTLYLRNMPVALVRQAKAEAARQGKTLANIVVEGLTLTLSRAAQADAPRTRAGEAREGLRRDVNWYERNRASLLERYHGEYIAIVDNAVVDHDRDFERLARRAFKRFGARSIFMPRVTEAPERIRVRSPRLRSGKRALGAPALRRST